MKNNHNIYFTTNFTEISCLDVLLEEVLGLTTNGTFLEIGAYDGITNSKTHHLANIGWQGIYVEPIKEYADKCAAIHSNNKVKVICAAISDEDKTETIFKSKLSSTLLAENKNAMTDYRNSFGKSHHFTEEEVLVYSWNTFIEKFKVEVPNILIVDAEGCDWKIINSIDYTHFRPQIIFTEIFTPNYKFISEKVVEEGEKIKEKLLLNNYHIWVVENNNMVFVDAKMINENNLLNTNQRQVNSIFNLLDQLTEQSSDDLKSQIIQRRGDAFLYSLFETSIDTQNEKLSKFLFTKINQLGTFANIEKKKLLISKLCMKLFKLKKQKETIPYFQWLYEKEPENKILRNQLILLKKM
ncbi:MAG: FkbM family methyltransferase [Flavobacteriales bacterium]